LQPLDAERVKEWRHRRMLSQQEVADRAGTSLFTIQRIERGEGNVRPKTGRGVAAALDIPIEELLPKAQAPLFRESPEQPPEERRADAFDVALDAARRQAVQDRQAFNRTVESERAQTYFKRYENAGAMELLKYPADELAGALLEAAGRCIELESKVRRPERLEQEIAQLKEGDIRMRQENARLRQDLAEYRAEAEREEETAQ
jgi:transcriptional regulator with XRE-family HTH domain